MVEIDICQIDPPHVLPECACQPYRLARFRFYSYQKGDHHDRSMASQYSIATVQFAADVATAFAEATDGILGAGYVPLLYVGSQLVAGQNYMLICKQTLVLKEPKVHVVKMVIYDPLPVEKEHGAKAIIREVENLL